MKGQIRFLIVVYIAIMLLPLSTGIITPNQAQQGTEIFLPERVELEAFLSSGSGNDIFFKSNVDNAILNHEFKSTESSYDLYSYDGTEKNDLGTFNPLVSNFNAPDFNVLYHASNQSNLDLDLLYTAVYYDLTGGEDGLNGLTSMVLFEDEMSGFRFDAKIGIPLILDIKMKGQRDEMLKMDLFLVSPSGEVYDYSTVNDRFETFINEFIPIVPNEDGLHTVYLSPANDDIILESIQIYSAQQPVDIDSGYTANWKGTETQTIFFKLNQDQSDEVAILDLTAKVFYNDSVAAPDVLLGRIDMDIFSPTTTPFGREFPATVIQWKGNATYVSITVTPPNEEDQFIKAAKDELGLSPGFDVEYAFWVESFEVDDFTPDEDFILEVSSNPATNAYFWNLASDTLVGINSSGAALVQILNLDKQDEIPFILDSSKNNILNVGAHDPTILPAGNYLLLFTGTPLPSKVRIHTIPLLSLNVGDLSTYGLNLDQSLYFSLPVNLPSKEYFNFTYMDEINYSISVEYDVYDSSFNLMQTSNYVFDDYYQSSTHFQDNTTLFGNANRAAQYNVQIGYLRIIMVGNQLHNATGAEIGPATNSTVQGRLRIERMNYLEYWMDNDPDVHYESSIFTNNDFKELNGSKNEIVIVYDFVSRDLFTGYSMMFSSENISYTIRTFVNWNSLWHTVTVNTPTNIDGINYYNYELEFGTNMATNFAIVIIFGNPTLNGTFNMDLQEFIIQGTPEVQIGEINVLEYDAPFGTLTTNGGTGGSTSDDNFLEGNIVPIAVGALIVAGAGGGTFVLLKRRKV